MKDPVDFYQHQRTGGLFDNGGGQYMVRAPRSGQMLQVIASWAEGWDHVSVSLPNRCPSWDEMCFTKSVFFEADETVMQLHPPEADWINNHPHCLHLWRPHTDTIPRPPAWMVGVKGLGLIT